MRSRSIALLTGTLAVSVALVGCGPVITNQGEPVTEERSVGDVTEVRLQTSGNLTVAVGDEPSLTVTAGKNVLEHLTTEVSGDTLVLDTDGGWGNHGAIDYTLTLPRLTDLTVAGSGDVRGQLASGEALSVTIKGSGDVRLDEVDAAELRLSISGSGDVQLDGSVSRQDVEIKGSGDYDGLGLDSQEAVVDVAGSGNVEVQVSDRLDATIAGSGSIRYEGDPQINSTTRGSGSIEQR
ncbi:head GIN domain-containing protein [Cellulomonas timonensis]|uniref:head GIN domain-containing protein n=1 Tax=Cellulomonas timonensis TaxID=1689271 RepID=UPI000829F619|nr:head GIN domain-containing protein [Cellulomonas timonensis]